VAAAAGIPEFPHRILMSPVALMAKIVYRLSTISPVEDVPLIVPLRSAVVELSVAPPTGTKIEVKVAI
jgi:hypothetical protein